MILSYMKQTGGMSIILLAKYNYEEVRKGAVISHWNCTVVNTCTYLEAIHPSTHTQGNFWLKGERGMRV